MPLPASGAADRVHYPLLQNLRQRPSEYLHERQGQPVDPNVVVFPEAAGSSQVAVGALPRVVAAGAHLPVPVDEVGLAPQLALPLAGLGEQVAPGDAAVLRRVETAVRAIRPGRVVEAPDQAVLEREPGEQGEVALGDAEGHVDAPDVAPGPEHAAVPQNHAVGAAARPGRADDLVPGRRLDASRCGQSLAKVVGPIRLGFVAREGDGLGERRRVEPALSAVGQAEAGQFWLATAHPTISPARLHPQGTSLSAAAPQGKVAFP